MQSNTSLKLFSMSPLSILFGDNNCRDSSSEHEMGSTLSVTTTPFFTSLPRLRGKGTVYRFKIKYYFMRVSLNWKVYSCDLTTSSSEMSITCLPLADTSVDIVALTSSSCLLVFMEKNIKNKNLKTACTLLLDINSQLEIITGSRIGIYKDNCVPLVIYS